MQQCLAYEGCALLRQAPIGDASSLHAHSRSILRLPDYDCGRCRTDAQSPSLPESASSLPRHTASRCSARNGVSSSIGGRAPATRAVEAPRFSVSFFDVVFEIFPTSDGCLCDGGMVLESDALARDETVDHPGDAELRSCDPDSRQSCNASMKQGGFISEHDLGIARQLQPARGRSRSNLNRRVKRSVEFRGGRSLCALYTYRFLYTINDAEAFLRTLSTGMIHSFNATNMAFTNQPGNAELPKNPSHMQFKILLNAKYPINANQQMLRLSRHIQMRPLESKSQIVLGKGLVVVCLYMRRQRSGVDMTIRVTVRLPVHG